MNKIKDYEFYKVYAEDKYLELCERLESKLPHGSGINGDWHIRAYKYNGIVHLIASNHYDAIDEYGFYCHVYSINAYYAYNPVTRIKCPYCMNKYNAIPGFRSYDDLQQYGWSLQNFIDKLGGMSMHNGWYIKCNSCDNGLKTIPEFQLTDGRILYGKELKCCGYGLEDYLSQVLYIWTE